MKNSFTRKFAGTFLSLAFALTPLIGQAKEEVNLYSARIEDLIKPLLDQFSEDTGVTVNLVTGNADELLQRLQREGRNTPADLVITTDAGRLHRAMAADVIQPVQSDLLDQQVPASYREPAGYWYGLSLRARPIMYAIDRVDPASLSTYEDLQNPKWKNKICTRSSDSIYNQSLVASIIDADGAAATEKWAKGLVNNFSRPPQGGDRDQIKAVAAGQCDIAIANTYYLAGMVNGSDKADQAAAEKVAVFWPNQHDRGTHVNVSGAAVTKHAKNRDNAIKLMEYLTSDKAQQWYANANGEYPLRADIAIGDTLEKWGDFKADDINMGKLGEFNADALRLMDRAGWQ